MQAYLQNIVWHLWLRRTLRRSISLLACQYEDARKQAPTVDWNVRYSLFPPNTTKKYRCQLFQSSWDQTVLSESREEASTFLAFCLSQQKEYVSRPLCKDYQELLTTPLEPFHRSMIVWNFPLECPTFPGRHHRVLTGLTAFIPVEEPWYSELDSLPHQRWTLSGNAARQRKDLLCTVIVRHWFARNRR